MGTTKPHRSRATHHFDTGLALLGICTIIAVVVLSTLLVGCSGHVDAELEPTTSDAAVELVNPDCHQIADKSACEDRVPGWVGPEPACGERAEFLWGCQHHYGECIRGPSAWVTRRCDGFERWLTRRPRL